MIVAIDGPAGSGKSSTARAVAERLGFRHLESGAFYRALTRAALDAGIEPDAWQDLSSERLDALDVHGEPSAAGFRLFAGKRDLTGRLRSGEVDAHVSAMARVPAVREWLFSRLRRAAAGRDVVADGRDMGTVVFPEAGVKVFLTAHARTRASRRLADHGVEDPDERELAGETERLRERDRIDSERTVAPLRRAPDAITIDTSDLSFDDQVRRIAALVEARRRLPG